MNRLFGLVIVGLLSFSSVSACSCEILEACEAYSFADIVFTGKLVALKEGVSNEKTVIDATFETIEYFKGDGPRMSKAKFRAGGCEPDLLLGQIHIVYKGDLGSPLFCNPTKVIRDLSKDTKFLQELRSSKRSFTISGAIIGATASIRPHIKIELLTHNGRFDVSVDSDGNFRYVTDLIDESTVRVSFPVGTRFRMKRLGMVSDILSNSVEFTVSPTKSHCDRRVFELVSRE
ncbi:MAG: hypothetical protein JNL64_04240 [Blastocatellia bacterium]|nr:hypothetical protein [Blastocatellia bacterium]